MTSTGSNWRKDQEDILKYRKQITENIRNIGLRGACNEQHLRKMLRRILGSESPYRVGYGEIVFEDQTSSSQLDVIIYDTRIASPLFKCGEIVVIPAEAARIAIEIKAVFAIRSDFNKKLEATKIDFLKLKRESGVSVLYFCITSDKYTLQEHIEYRDTLSKYGIDDFFVLRGRRKEFNEGELERFINAVESICI